MLRELPASPVRQWPSLVGAGAIVGTAAYLRFHHLGLQELWLDEAFSFQMATAEGFRQLLFREANPPLYFALQRLWLHLFGETEAALRSLSAVAGTLFVAAVIWAGRRFLDSTAGLWAGALAAVSPLHVYYSQEARAYALLTLAILLTWIALWRALELGTRRSWALFSVCALLALGTHYLAALALLPTAVLVWIWPGESPAPRRGLRYGAALLLSASPPLLWLAWRYAFTPHYEGGHLWIERVWEELPPLLAIPKSLEVLALGSQAGLIPGFLKQFTGMDFSAALRLAGLAAVSALGLWAALPWGDRALGIPWLGRRKAWLAALLLAPLVLLWLASFHRPFYVPARYDLVALPPLVLILGLALAKLTRVRRFGPPAAVAIAALLLAVLGGKLSLYYGAPSVSLGPSARGTARAIDAFVETGDLVLFTPLRGAAVAYYLRRLGYRRSEGRCANPTTGRAFLCPVLPYDDQGLIWDFDHVDRVAFSLETSRGDLRELLGALGSPSSAVWLERRANPGVRWARAHRMILSELARWGFRPAATPGPLRRLEVAAFRRGGSGE